MAEHWSLLEWFEFLSYVATVVGIPLAIIVFLHEERKERQAEQEEIYDKLMEHYKAILDKFLEHPELDSHETLLGDPRMKRQQMILYEMLVSLFERSFILLYGEHDKAYQRMWYSWEDYINEWIARPNFRNALPQLMRGEDEDFVHYMEKKTGLRFD